MKTSFFLNISPENTCINKSPINCSFRENCYDLYSLLSIWHLHCSFKVNYNDHAN